MVAKRIDVHRYPGAVEENVPRKFDLDGNTVEVDETVENWLEKEGRSSRHYFKVKGDDDRLYTLFFDEKRSEWFCE